MTFPKLSWQTACAIALSIAALVFLPLHDGPSQAGITDTAAIAAVFFAALVASLPVSRTVVIAALFAGSFGAAWILIASLPETGGTATTGFWLLLVAAWLLGWRLVTELSGDGRSQRFADRAFDPDRLWRLDPDPVGSVSPAARVCRLCCCRRPRPSARASSRPLPILAADFRQTVLKAVLFGFVVGSACRLPGGDPRRPVPVSGERAAADRQSGLGAADHRHRADHGDLVRLRLAVQGGRGHRHDLLPDAGEHDRGAESFGARWSAT